MRRAFTLLEILVATMLLSMLVTILTMIFNQSSIAWSTGVAAIAGLSDVRENIAIYSGESENVIRQDFGKSDMLRVASVWDTRGTGLRTDTSRTLVRSFERLSLSATDLRDPLPEKTFAAGSGSSAGRDTFIVGVTSWGPDGKEGTWDDITTMSEEVVK